MSASAHQLQQIVRSCPFGEFASEFDRAFVTGGEWCNRLRAAGGHRRPHGTDRRVGEEVGKRLRLKAAAFVEWALEVVAVPTGAIAGGGMAHEVQGHGPAR